MRHPPYHLRPNKAVDRALLLEVIGRLQSWCLPKSLTYYGLGGPFLDDVRLISQRFPTMKFVSIECNGDTHRRQRFHRSTKNVRLVNESVESYLKHKFRSGARCVFWLDYTKFRPAQIEEFKAVLGLVGTPSIVKVTVRAQFDDPVDTEAGCLRPAEAAEIHQAWMEDLQQRFNDYLPRELKRADLRRPETATLVQEMLQIAAQSVLPTGGGVVFQLVHSCTYADGPTQMLSVTGVVCDITDRDEIARGFRDWAHANTDWGAPHPIDVPDLSVKERLYLEKHLPAKVTAVRALQRALGYKIDKTADSSMRKLQQYQEFHAYYPLFSKVNV